MADPETEPDPTELTGMIKDLRAANEPNSSLLIEHLQSARVNYLGGRTEEYRLSLELADAAADGLQGESLRSRSRAHIQKLKSACAPSEKPIETEKHLDDLVDEASEESFPASDPPAY